MRVVFNSFDTHADPNNILDVASVTLIKGTIITPPKVSVSMLDPDVLIGQVGDSGSLLIEDTTTGIQLFNGTVTLTDLNVFNIKEEGLSFCMYQYYFEISV